MKLKVPIYLSFSIIHPCTHPEDKPPPKNEDEMMVAIFDCIDRLVSIVRPRKLLYMAIDGVGMSIKILKCSALSVILT